MAGSYISYVLSQSQRNPCLQNLCQFLNKDEYTHPCRIACLEYSACGTVTTQFSFNPAALVGDAMPISDKDKVLGRLFIVEDLDRSTIEILGSAYKIDPLFFASHVDGPYQSMVSSKPSFATLPSKRQKQNFLNLQYHRTIDFESDVKGLKRLLRDCNVPRKVMVLNPTSGKYLGLAQHCSSTLLMTHEDSTWTGIILADGPITDKFCTKEKQMSLRWQLFQGGYEGFLGNELYDGKEALKSSGPARQSLLEDLVFYWMKERPPGFDPRNPRLLAMAYYPLKVVASEWMSYVAILSNSIKQYEYSSQTSVEDQGIAKLDMDLRSLEVWGRRCMQTMPKLRSVNRFILSRAAKDHDPAWEEYLLIAEDYEQIAKMVETFGRRLESMIPVVTSLVQIADTRRSLREATNVTRLTNLALLFVPLSFVSSLLSMNDGVSSRGLSLFCAVAIPLCLMVFLVARVLPHIDIEVLLLRIRRTGRYSRVNV